jgi:hypothetical protein
VFEVVLFPCGEHIHKQADPVGSVSITANKEAQIQGIFESLIGVSGVRWVGIFSLKFCAGGLAFIYSGLLEAIFGQSAQSRDSILGLLLVQVVMDMVDMEGNLVQCLGYGLPRVALTFQMFQDPVQ